MKRRSFIIAGLIVILTSIVLFVRFIDRGGFEKDLIPDYCEVQAGWRNIYGPFVKTQWKQDGQYAMFAPGHDLLGCWSVAFAQVLAFHHLRPSGDVKYTTTGGALIDIKFNEHGYLDSLANSITPETPAEQSQAIAEYCYAVAVVVQKDFGIGDYMDVSVIPAEVTDHFKCRVDKFDSDLRNKIISEGKAARPVVAYFDDILGIRVVRNGHAMVIDGTADVNGRTFVHVNVGWGGKEDGWYNYDTLARGRKLLYIFTIATGI
jgi:hypothetical protein